MNLLMNYIHLVAFTKAYRTSDLLKRLRSGVYFSHLNGHYRTVSSSVEGIPPV